MAWSAAAPIRQGSRAALSPPGWPSSFGDGRAGGKPVGSTSSNSPPHDSAVFAQTKAVEGQSQDRPPVIVLGHHRRHVRMVVLHGKRPHPEPGRNRLGVPRAVEVRMQIVRDGGRPTVGQ